MMCAHRDGNLKKDGTLLNSKSMIAPASVSAIKAALDRGVHVIAATGKARPAALAAARAAGLEGLLVCQKGPGIFLQGLAVHGRDGSLLRTASMPGEAVRAAMTWARESRVPCCAFLGDECLTLEQGPELEQLHVLYYEPLARVVNDVEDVIAAGSVKKVCCDGCSPAATRVVLCAPHVGTCMSQSHLITCRYYL